MTIYPLAPAHKVQSQRIRPQLAMVMTNRHQLTQRLARFYIASLSAIAGLSVLGQVLIQQSLNHQAMEIQIVQATLEHKRLVNQAIRELRELQRSNNRHQELDDSQTEREALIAEAEAKLEDFEVSWHTLADLSNREFAPMLYRQHHAKSMVEQLRPAYLNMLEQLNRTLEQSSSEQLQIQPISPRRLSSSRPSRRSIPAAESVARPSASNGSANSLIRAERRYMRQIEQVLQNYNQAIQRNIQQLKRLELGLLVVMLSVLLLEGIFIFRPVVSQTQHALSELARSLDATEKTAMQLAREQQKSENLLLNILPASIAQRLKQRQQPIAEAFDEATVLFADIVGFTQLSTEMPPQELVRLLNQIFSAFDALVAQQGLEKIKTIGDAYMVVGGLPMPRADHAEAIAMLAVAMQQAIEQFNQQQGHQLRIRIGIHSGPVVAGVIGTHKFIYDLWGDTVNVASRMESHGEAGRIQISEATAERLGAHFQLQPRGPIQIKGKGSTPTYWMMAHPQTHPMREDSGRVMELPSFVA